MEFGRQRYFLPRPKQFERINTRQNCIPAPLLRLLGLRVAHSRLKFERVGEKCFSTAGQEKSRQRLLQRRQAKLYRHNCLEFHRRFKDKGPLQDGSAEAADPAGCAGPTFAVEPRRKPQKQTVGSDLILLAAAGHAEHAAGPVNRRADAGKRHQINC